MQEMAQDQVEFKAQVNQERAHASKMHDQVVANMKTMQDTFMLTLMQAVEGIKADMTAQFAGAGHRERSAPRRADRRGRETDRNTREMSEVIDATGSSRRQQDRSEGPTQRRRRTQVDEVMSVSDASDSE